MGNLTNKVALVTGGSRGIGAAIVKKLVADGATIAFTYVSAAEKAAALTDELSKSGNKVLAIKADSGNVAEVTAAVEQTVKVFGRLDILVNSAGVLSGGAVDSTDLSTEAIDRQYAVNVTGVAAAVRAASKYIGDGGRIVSVGSVLGDRTGIVGVADYSATKAAVASYTRGWAWDLAKKNITVNTIQPGPIDTDMNPDNESDFSKHLKAGIALGRYGKAEEVAAAVSFLVSPEASFITGVTLNVDGGHNA